VETVGTLFGFLAGNMTWTWTLVSHHETTERIVLCFDRDRTVSVNPHPDHRAMPIGWIQWYDHVEEIPVFATGNQHLRTEAKIPGIREAERLWEELEGEEYEYQNSQFEDYVKPRRRGGLRLIRDVYEATYPDEDFRFIVVDDVDVSDLAAEGPWCHYLPWKFVETVESGDFALEEPLPTRSGTRASRSTLRMSQISSPTNSENSGRYSRGCVPRQFREITERLPAEVRVI